MRTRYLILFLTLALLALFGFQKEDPTAAPPTRMPNGSLQSEEILKAEHAASVKDAARLKQLSDELAADLEKNDRHVVSMQTLKKLDEMERIIKRVRGRMKRL